MTCRHTLSVRHTQIKMTAFTFCLGTGVPRHRDGVIRPYICTYVFSELCSIFQYVIKRWLHVLQLSRSVQRAQT